MDNPSTGCCAHFVTTGRGAIEYRGTRFRSLLEARWAVFFETHGDTWHYEQDGWPIGNTKHYRPQLWLRHRGIYLEVRDRWDPLVRRPMLHSHPEAEEQCVFLAAGDPPTEQQMRAVGWWDPAQRRGVLQLTAGFEWELMFPSSGSDVLASLEAARTETFEPPVPGQRRNAGAVRDAPAERDRDTGR